MSNKSFHPATTLYHAGTDTVKTLDIVAKGTVRATRDYCAINLPIGSIIGIGERPGEAYTFSYETVDEVTIFSYPYDSEASLVAVFKSNHRLLGTLVAGCIRFARNLQAATLDTMEQARSEYNEIMEAQAEYEKLAIAAGEKPGSFPELTTLSAPDMLDPARGWHRDFVEDLFANETSFKKDVYAIPSIGLGMGLTVNSYALESREFISTIFAYLEDLRFHSEAFMTSCRALKAKISSKGTAAKNVEEEHVEKDPSVENCLDAIQTFASPDAKLIDHFRALVKMFAASGDRYGSDDETRRMRRELTSDFYEIYTICFLKANNTLWTSIPLGVRMFLLFGFVDLKLAGEDNAEKMGAIAETLIPGKNGRVVTIYEWLNLVYHGQVMPSKNEFDLDYPAYLKDCRRNGEISESDEIRLQDSDIDKLRFEIKNMFTLGNRVTFGRITTFSPVFDKDNVVGHLENMYLNAAKVGEQIERIRSIDYSAYCRQGVFSMPEAGINALYTQNEVLPYVILMPNVGTRASLWQEIDSKKRSTPARMIIPIFYTESPEDAFIKLTGEFRWEMCKTEQGVHWNDITDPSLTSMYCDYLQFYRKNSALSPETKDKISVALKNNSNNFKKVFVEDYFIFIKYESQGALRLNRYARTILFTFCPFSAEIREKIAENPQFAQCIKHHEATVAQKVKIFENAATKIQKKGDPVPAEIAAQIRQLQK